MRDLTSGIPVSGCGIEGLAMAPFEEYPDCPLAFLVGKRLRNGVDPFIP